MDSSMLPKVQIYCFINSIGQAETGELLTLVMLSDEGDLVLRGKVETIYQAQEIAASDSSETLCWQYFPKGNFERIWIDKPMVSIAVRRAYAIHAARYAQGKDAE